ncbi:hypothetical protein F6P93_20135 [Escherichia coli]|nr:hypothetical protein F6P93_20135 [Escherichia coli]
MRVESQIISKIAVKSTPRNSPNLKTVTPSIHLSNRRKCGVIKVVRRSPLLLILWTYRSGMSFVWLIAGKLSEIAAIRTHPP